MQEEKRGKEDSGGCGDENDGAIGNEGCCGDGDCSSNEADSCSIKADSCSNGSGENREDSDRSGTRTYSVTRRSPTIHVRYSPIQVFP